MKASDNDDSAPSGSSQALCELSAMPGGAELCGGYAARSRRCLMALTPMSAPGEDAERVECDNYRVHVRPVPCGADRADEYGECGQDDEAEPFEGVVDAVGDEPVGHVMGDVGCSRASRSHRRREAFRRCRSCFCCRSCFTPIKKMVVMPPSGE